ncbi:MAG TPA: hypothetical protein VGF17_29830 [Phytomonospora sp.]
MSAFTATIEPADAPEGETAVVLRVANTSAEPAAVPDPDLGRPSAPWEHSAEAYRASLLASFGILAVTVYDADGEEVAKAPVSTWSTPLRRPDLVLEPGETLDVVVPLGVLFRLAAGAEYRVVIAYGDAVGEGVVRT